MKTIIIWFALSLILTNLVFEQKNVNIQNRLETISNKYWISYNDYKFGDYLISKTASRNISHIKTDSVGAKILVFTDIDSLSFNLYPYDTIYLNITSKKELNSKVLKVIGLPKKTPKQQLTFLNKSSIRIPDFQLPPIDEKYLLILKDTYKLKSIIAGAKSDIEKLNLVTSWVHNQWNHDGGNMPSKPNALTILSEAREGKHFRCVEYSIVISEIMQALGYKSRVLGLKRKECETLLTSAGHAVAEVFLPELNKWVFADGQFNAIPFLFNIPLNAVEFQEALNKAPLKIKFGYETTLTQTKDYLEWVYPYLYFFDYRVQYKKANIEHNSLMLVPLKSKKPKYFQKKWGVGQCLYTNNLKAFYPK
ncbi:transglutaminase-like domain-containing protein [Seonamhaeicola marinus]|uniref:Transglutaminase domain-containing protein n=1 Tax=Seonamhaeicola marinus TaxID=1912246 RepID=A0A5D0I5Q9_9FLAO|nr:transglutaminase-like domain-containing protein [Seonamhaeicola marinus]TYA78718.1 transglutaminase domain-containing protein [Seonamhaeicola marinus]